MKFSNDPSEEMILQNEYRRDRMHEAVDEVETHFHGRWQVTDYATLNRQQLMTSKSPNGIHDRGKTCLIQNCFAWCLEHHDISTEADGEEVVTTRILDKDENEKIRERFEHEIQRRCRTRMQKQKSGDYCDIVVSGQHYNLASEQYLRTGRLHRRGVGRRRIHSLDQRADGERFSVGDRRFERETQDNIAVFLLECVAKYLASLLAIGSQLSHSSKSLYSVLEKDSVGGEKEITRDEITENKGSERNEIVTDYQLSSDDNLDYYCIAGGVQSTYFVLQTYYI